MQILNKKILACTGGDVTLSGATEDVPLDRELQTHLEAVIGVRSFY